MMKPKWKGALVLELLNQPGAISCHSRFAHGVNLKIGEDLVYIGDDQKGCVPFGIHLSQAQFARLNQPANWQSPIKQVAEGLQFSRTTLAVRDCPIFDNRLTAKAGYLRQRNQIPNQLLKENLRGTGLDFEPVMAKALFKEGDLTAVSSAFVSHYIGRGLGLTPAGDDFIIGLLAVDTLEPFLPACFRPLVRQALLEKRTTDVSESYLASAIGGHFSSLVTAIFTSWQSPQLAQKVAALEASGSTSGRDTVAGIVYGLQHILENDRR